MIDYVGRSQGPVDRARTWNSYWSEQEAAAQQQWQNREQRRRYDEEQRRIRAESGLIAEQYNRDAGLLGDMSDEFSGLTVRNTGQAAMTNPAGVRPGVAPSAGITTQTPTPDITTQTPTASPATATTEPSALKPSFTNRYQGGGSLTPAQFTVNNTAQRVAYNRYVEAITGLQNGTVNERVFRGTLTALTNAGVITRAQADNEYTRALSAINQAGVKTAEGAGAYAGSVIGRAVAQPQEPVTVGLQPDGATGTSAAATVDASLAQLDAYYQGVRDTSRPLQPTREMRMLSSVVNNYAERARLYAQHGRPDLADQAWASALQGQAEYLQQSRMVLLRAAAQGSYDAAALLYSEYAGYPPGAIRLQPTDETRTRFITQIDTGNGQWVSGSEAPMDFSRLVDNLQNLVDREGAAARLEAATNMASINAQNARTMMEVQGRERVAVLQALTDIEVAQTETTREMLNNNARVVLNQETGDYFLWYPTTDLDGNPTYAMRVINMEEQPSANVDGEGETVRVPVSRSVTNAGVTGTVGVQRGN